MSGTVTAGMHNDPSNQDTAGVSRGSILLSFIYTLDYRPQALKSFWQGVSAAQRRLHPRRKDAGRR